MAVIKITVDTGGQKYISTSTPGGGNDKGYDMSTAMIAKNDPSNFSSFHGTESEWKGIIATSSIKIENLGN